MIMARRKLNSTLNHHYEETLPCGLCPELPFFRRELHLLLVHRFVDHSGYLAVAAERQPAYAVFGVAPVTCLSPLIPFRRLQDWRL